MTSSAGPPVELRPDDRGGFAVYTKLLGFIPVRVPFLAQASLRFERVGDDDAIVVVANGQRGFGGTRIAPSEIPESWRARLGRYRPRGGMLFERGDLEIDGGMLRLSLVTAGFDDQPLSIALEPVDAERAKLLGYGRNTGGYLFAEGEGEASVIDYRGVKMEYVSAPEES